MSEIFVNSGENSNNFRIPTPRLQGLFLPGIDNPLATDGLGIVTPWGGGGTARKYTDYGYAAEQNTQLSDLASSLIPAEGAGVSYSFEGLIGPQGERGRDGRDGIIHIMGLNLPQNSNFLSALPHNLDLINDLGTAVDKLIYTNAYNTYTENVWTERQPAGDVTGYWSAMDSDSDGSNLIAADYGGRLWTSADSGVNWTERGPLTDIVQQYWSQTGSELKVYCSAFQTFITTGAYTLSKVLLRLAKNPGQAATTATIKLYAVDGNHEPTGDSLYTIGTIDNDDLTTSLAWKTFSSLSYALTATTEYAIVISIAGDSVCTGGGTTDSGVRWGGDSGYSGGIGGIRHCSLNGVWACEAEWSGAGIDWNFYCYSYEKANANWRCVASDSDGSHLIAGILNGRLYTSADSGVTWTERQPAGDTSHPWISVDSDSDGSHLVACGYNGRLYTSANFGVDWTERSSASNKLWSSVASNSDGSKIIVALKGGTIYTSVNGGADWTARYPAGAGSKNWEEVASDSDGTFLMASKESTTALYISTNSGVDWTERVPDAGASADSYRVACDSDGSHCIASNGSSTYTSSNSGVDWTTEDTVDWGDGGVASDNDGSNLMSGGSSGRLFTKGDVTLYSEATWAEAALTSAGRAILDDANAAAQATTLGLGTGDAVTHNTLTLSSIAAEATDVDKFLVDSTGVIKYRTGAEVLSDIGASASTHLHDGDTLEHDGVNSDGGVFSFTTTGAVTFNQSVGVGINPSYKFSVGSPNGLRQAGFYHSNSNAHLTMDYGKLVIGTDEGTNTITTVTITGKGTGYGALRINDNSNNQYLFMSANDDSGGNIRVAGSSLIALNLQSPADVPIKMFKSAASGETQELLIYGYRTEDALRSLEIGVGIDAADTASFDGVSNYKFDGVIEATGATLSGLTQGSVLFAGASGVLSQDNSNVFWDNTVKRLGIGINTGFFPGTGLTVSGEMDILHTAGESDDHAIEIDVDVAGFGDVKAIDIDYITGDISAGTDEGVILINIDEIQATGGDIFGLEVLATEGAAGSTVTVYGVKAAALVGPIHQDSGTFDNPTIATNDTISTNVPYMIDGLIANVTPIFSSVPNDDDYILIGDIAVFEEIEFIITTGSSGAGIKPKFEYSRAGSHLFTEFFPVDGTNGFRNTGVVAWDASDLTGHGLNTDTTPDTYCIKITRQRANLTTTPILGFAKVAATTEYIWDKSGNVNINNLTLAASIELGHASDTTITRASAGNLNIEGNLIYRAGGTDVPIADGGTGQSTAQLAINALSAVSGATNEYVLTKDTATGNAVYKAAGGGGMNYVDRGDPTVFDWIETGSKAVLNTDNNWHDLDLSSIVPAGAVLVHFQIIMADEVIGNYFSLRKNGNSNTINTTVCRVEVANRYPGFDVSVACDANRVVEYLGSNVAFAYIGICIRGWWIPA